MELSFKQLKKLEVINVADGSSLGFPVDIKIDFPLGMLTGIVVPGKKQFFIFKCLNRGSFFIERNKIQKIGGDVILVNLKCGDLCEGNSTVIKPPTKDSPCVPPCNDNFPKIDLNDY